MMAMMKSSTSAAVVLCFTILVGTFLAGCATIACISVFPEPPQIYGGVRAHIEVAGNDIHGSRLAAIAFTISDFPFSLILDTVLLPLTIPGEIYALAAQHQEGVEPED